MHRFLSLAQTLRRPAVALRRSLDGLADPPHEVIPLRRHCYLILQPEFRQLVAA
jgi:hypothetical protein